MDPSIETKHQEYLNSYNSKAYQECPLVYVAFKNDIEMMRYYLSIGTDPNVKYKNLHNALHITVDRKNLEGTELLLQHKADSNVYNHNDYLPLHLSINNNHDEMVALLIRYGADVNKPTNRPFRHTPLILAIKNNSFEITQMLLSNGANLNIGDDNGFTPLYHAVYEQGFRHKNVGLVELLINNGADLSLTYSDDGNTILHCAAINRNISAIELLLKKGVNPNGLNRKAKTPLHSICLIRMSAGRSDDLIFEMIKMLLLYGAVDTPDDKNMTFQQILRNTRLYQYADYIRDYSNHDELKEPDV